MIDADRRTRRQMEQTATVVEEAAEEAKEAEAKRAGQQGAH